MYEISCEMCMDLIPLVLDGVASADSRTAVEHHAAGCQCCKAALAGEILPDDGADAGIQKAMKRVRWLVTAVVAAFLIFCLVSITLVFGELSVMYLLLALGAAALLRFAFGAVKAGRGKKLAARIGGVALVVFLVIVGNMLAGNPVSWLLARGAVEEYLEEAYPNTDYTAERVTFNFKDGDYYAPIVSQSSIDTHFTVYIDMLGNVRYDTFDSVTNGWNTAQRLGSAYRELTDPVLKGLNLTCTVDIGFGRLEFVDPEGLAFCEYPWAVCTDELEVDGIYDLAELGSRAGRLIVDVRDENVTAERAAELLLQIREMMDEAGVRFYVIDFELRHPKPGDGSAAPEGVIDVNGFLYTDIYEEGMTQRVVQAVEATKAYYAALDAE